MNYDRFLTRVWDKIENKMIYSGEIIRNIHHNVRLLGISNNEIIIERMPEQGTMFDKTEVDTISFGDRFIPMQCTGLKDKNGELIYEGNLISIDKDFAKIADVDLKYCPVGIQEGCAMYQRNKNHFLREFNTYLWMVTDETNYCEIVGNCWQNPELLEQNK